MDSYTALPYLLYTNLLLSLSLFRFEVRVEVLSYIFFYFLCISYFHFLPVLAAAPDILPPTVFPIFISIYHINSFFVYVISTVS